MRMLAPAICLFAAAGCNATGRGKELSDGCYYAGQQPVLRISGNRGDVLIDGDLKTVAVSRAKTKSVTQAIFSPGFDLVPGPPLRAKENTKFPKVYYMMDPLSSIPTILMYDDAATKLRLGPDC